MEESVEATLEENAIRPDEEVPTPDTENVTQRFQAFRKMTDSVSHFAN